MARTLGLNPESLEIARQLESDPALCEEVKSFIETRRLAQKVSILKEADEPSHDVEPFNYAEEFRKVFIRTGHHAAREEPPVPGGVVNPELYRERTQEDIQEAREDEPSPGARFKCIPKKVWEGRCEDTRKFLEAEYAGECQICNSVFVRRSDGRPYFEGLYIVHRTHARWIDHRGNVLCLCPTCCAKFQYGSVEADDIMSQILQLRVRKEGGTEKLLAYLNLCGDKCIISFSERHLLALQELLKSDE